MGGGVPLLLFAIVATSLSCFAEGRPQSVDQRPETLPVRPFIQSERRHSHDGAQQSSSQPVRPFDKAVAREGEERGHSQGQSLPVRPFNPYDSRGGDGGSSSQRVAPSSSTRREEEDPYQSRAHSAPLNPVITLQSEQNGQQQRNHHHHGTRQSSGSGSQNENNRRKGETPNWTTGQVRLDERPVQSGVVVMGDGRVGQQSPSTPLQRDNRRTNPQEQKGKPGTRGVGQQGGAVDRGMTIRMGTVEAPAETAGKKSEGGAGEEEGIVFPGPTRDGGNEGKGTPGKFAPHIGAGRPNCAKGSTFCESTEDYPSEYVKSVLRSQAENLKEFFGNDLLQNDSSLVQRIDSPDEDPLCQSVEQVVYPKMAQNKEEKWLYVVNQDQYIQGVRVEKCLKPESECLLTKSFPLGYKTMCRQKYIYRRMLALNDDGKTLSDTFRLPSCCSCYYKRSGT